MTESRRDDFFSGDLGQVINGYRATQIVYAAAKLGIPDLLAHGPKTTAELAEETGTDPHARVGRCAAWRR
jgi:hypothetical protein